MKDKEKFKSALGYFGLTAVGCFVLIISLVSGEIVVTGGNMQSEATEPIKFYTTILIFGLISVATLILGLKELIESFSNDNKDED